MLLIKRYAMRTGVYTIEATDVKTHSEIDKSQIEICVARVCTFFAYEICDLI